MRIAEDFEESVRKMLAEGTDRGKGQNEIADGSAANDQNFTAKGHGAAKAMFKRGGTLINTAMESSSKLQKSQGGDEEAEEEPDAATDLDSLLACRGPIQQVAQSPGRNGEPHARKDHGISPALKDQHPASLIEVRTSGVDHQF